MMGLYKEEQFILDKTVEQVAVSIAISKYICGLCYAAESGYCQRNA